MTYPEIAAHYRMSLEEMDWPDRKVTRSGLRKFLIAVWKRQQTHYREDWETVWLSNKFASDEAYHVWHKRIPAWHYDTDRARVAWYLRPRVPLLTGDQEKALRWAQNRT